MNEKATTATPAGRYTPSQKRPPTKAHERRLEEIKLAAAAQFYTAGYAATDVRTIADAVGFHVSTLYTYISGKEELLYLIMKDGIIAADAAFEQATAGIDELAVALRRAIEAMVLHHASRRFLAWTSHIEVRSLTGTYRDQIRSLQKEHEAKWLRLLDRGQASGEFRLLDPRVTVFMILGTGHSVSNWFRPDGRLSAQQLASVIADQILSGVLVPEHPPPPTTRRTRRAAGRSGQR